MARTELPNGVILPAEYSDDWYEDMTSNLTKLDDVIGSDSEKLNSNDVSFLRMSSAALTDSGTGNFSDLNSSNKLKTGDYILDSNRKLFVIASVDSANETFTVGNSLFKVTAESDLAPVAESGDYDDLTDKPNYGILRMTSETLSDSGSGAILNLNSDSKLAAGDYVLDAALKVFPITAVSAPNYTVGTALFQITNTSALAAVATSGDYDDLTDLPTYGITRFCSSAITDNSSVAFSAISSTNKIKIGDFLLDTVGKIYQISAVDTANETVAVTTPLTQLAVDSGVVHKSGNETIAGVKTFSDIPVFVSFDGIRFRCAHNYNAYITFRNANQVNPGSIILSAHDGTVSTAIHLVDKTLIPYTSNDIDLGTASRKWKSFNGLNPGSLSLPDLNNGIDISGYLSTGSTDNVYTPVSDGFITIKLIANSFSIDQNSIGNTSGYVSDIQTSERIAFSFLPVVKNVAVNIKIRACTAVISAYFYPCQGNV